MSRASKQVNWSMLVDQIEHHFELGSVQYYQAMALVSAIVHGDRAEFDTNVAVMYPDGKPDALGWPLFIAVNNARVMPYSQAERLTVAIKEIVTGEYQRERPHCYIIPPISVAGVYVAELTPCVIERVLTVDGGATLGYWISFRANRETRFAMVSKDVLTDV